MNSCDWHWGTRENWTEAMPPLPLLSLGIPGLSSLSGGDSQVQYQSLEIAYALLSNTLLLPIFVVGKLLFIVLIFKPIVNPRHVR